MEFNWDTEPAEAVLIESIVDRTFALCRKHGMPTGEKTDLVMDLIATHNHACRLDFKKLATARDFDLLHDIVGIKRHLNRECGRLEDSFLPRCAAV